MANNEFYTVVRVLRKADGTGFFDSCFDHQELLPAWAQHFSGLSSYLNNDAYDYVASYILRSDGAVVDWKAFDKNEFVPEAQE